MTVIVLVISFIGFFICLSVHEAAHAYMSLKLGDPTAKLEGRLSLNPLAHIDLIGTIVVPLFLIFSGKSMTFLFLFPGGVIRTGFLQFHFFFKKSRVRIEVKAIFIELKSPSN